MQQHEDTCGQELAAGAGVPEQLGALFKHLAENLRDHATWVGTTTAEAKREHDAMLATAESYDLISAKSEQAAAAMRALEKLPAVPHDASKLDRQKLADWTKKKIELQGKLASVLLAHAEQSQRVLDELVTGA